MLVGWSPLVGLCSNRVAAIIHRQLKKKNMDWEEFEKRKHFAGERMPSMLRRRVGHDYGERCIYLITMTVEDRRPLLGRLVGDAQAPDGSPDAPRVELSPLGERVRSCWQSIEHYHPEIRVLATMVMPDHLHGILFVQKQMEQHLGLVIKGFKTGCNKAYRELGFGLQQCCSKEDRRQGRETSESGERQGQCCSKEDWRQGRERNRGYLWARNYNDHILEGYGELDRWFTYLRDNPRRLAIRRAHPDYFRVVFNITVAGQCYAAIGNRFLLSYPKKQQVQCTRKLTEEQISKTVETMMGKANKGVLLVSPAISDGERAVMRAALDGGKPLIFLTPWGFNIFSKPGHEYYKACAEGKFLILAPWPHENRRIPLTREMCLALNEMAAGICRG